MTGIDRIRKAYQSRRESGPHYTATTLGDVEQADHGVTNAALAAWHQLREVWRSRVTEVRGTQTYRVPDMDGRRTITTPALVLATEADSKVFLTGCSWGYGGEGCAGTAAILHDLGVFSTLEAAQEFVGWTDFGGEWRLTKVDGEWRRTQ